MKKLILSIGLFALSLGAMAGEHGDKYCAKMRDGRMVLMHKGDVVTSSVTLDNGTIVKSDGTVVMKNGTTMMLKEGECIHKDGTMMMKDKKKKDNM